MLAWMPKPKRPMRELMAKPRTQVKPTLVPTTEVHLPTRFVRGRVPLREALDLARFHRMCGLGRRQINLHHRSKD
jgi:hypothetical protein